MRFHPRKLDSLKTHLRKPPTILEQPWPLVHDMYDMADYSSCAFPLMSDPKYNRL